MTPRARHTASDEAGTRALLDAFAVGAPNEILRLGDVFAGLGKRSFGMLLFVSTLPSRFRGDSGVTLTLAGSFCRPCFTKICVMSSGSGSALKYL